MGAKPIRIRLTEYLYRAGIGITELSDYVDVPVDDLWKFMSHESPLEDGPFERVSRWLFEREGRQKPTKPVENEEIRFQPHYDKNREGPSIPDLTVRFGELNAKVDAIQSQIETLTELWGNHDKSLSDIHESVIGEIFDCRSLVHNHSREISALQTQMKQHGEKLGELDKLTHSAVKRALREILND